MTQAMSQVAVEATKIIPIFDNKIILYGFGVNHAIPDQNWSLKGIEEYSTKNTHKHIIDTLNAVENVHEFFSPSPQECNSEIIREYFMKKTGVKLVISDKKTLYRGVKADGFGSLKKQQAFIMSSADCALLVLTVDNHVFTAHAGRDSLLDRAYIESGCRVRTKFYPSVIDALLSRIPRGKHHKICAHIGFAISSGKHFAHPASHPVYGEKNRRMLEWIATEYKDPSVCNKENFYEHGHLDLVWLIKQQLYRYGVTYISHDNVCTYGDKDEQDRHLWFSQRRTPGMRNLVIAARAH